MSIDEAIPILHDMYNYYNDTDIDAYVGFDKEDNNAVEIALETMRKYQQIEQMVKQYKKFGNSGFSMQIICGVLEDGKKD